MAFVMSFEDWVSQYGTITLTNDGGTAPTVASGYSLDSLKTRQLGDICRINSSTGATIIRIDFSETTSTAMAAALLSLVSDQAFTLTIKTYNSTTLRTSDVIGSISSLGASWLTSKAVLHETPSASIDRLEIWLAPFIGVSTKVDIGRIWYGNAFQSVHDSGLAWDTGPEDSGGVELSRGGQAYPRIGVISRTVRLPLPRIEPAEIFGVGGGSTGDLSTVLLEEGVHSVGKTGEFVAFQELATNPMRPVYGHFQEMPRFTANQYDYETSLVMREER